MWIEFIKSRISWTDEEFMTDTDLFIQNIKLNK